MIFKLSLTLAVALAVCDARSRVSRIKSQYGNTRLQVCKLLISLFIKPRISSQCQFEFLECCSFGQLHQPYQLNECNMESRSKFSSGNFHEFHKGPSRRSSGSPIVPSCAKTNHAEWIERPFARIFRSSWKVAGMHLSRVHSGPRWMWLVLGFWGSHCHVRPHVYPHSGSF